MKKVILIIFAFLIISCQERESSLVRIDNLICSIGTKYIHTKTPLIKEQQNRIKERIEKVDGIIAIYFSNRYKSRVSFSEYYDCREHDLAIKMIFKEEMTRKNQ